MEQKVIFFTPESIDNIGSQMKTQIEKHCIDGWYVHQVVPTHYQEYQGGCLRFHSSVIILHKSSEKLKTN